MSIRRRNNGKLYSDLEYLKQQYSPKSCRNTFKCRNDCKFKVSLELTTHRDITLLHLSCMMCHVNWYICQNCAYQRSPIVDSKKVSKHYSTFHVGKKLMKRKFDPSDET